MLCRRYRVNIMRTLPEISLQCQPEKDVQRPLKPGLLQTTCIHARVYCQRLLTSLIQESQLFIVTVRFAFLTNDRDIIILFDIVVIP